MELYNKILKEMTKEEKILFEMNEIEKCHFDPNKCFNCGGAELELENDGRVCLECGAIDERFKIFMSENYSCRKYAYNHTDYFQKCIEQYQGKQNCDISEALLEKIRLNVKGEITRASILLLLKEFKFVKHYKNVHRIYADLTGKLIDDIEYLEFKLIQDYREFTRVYKTLEADRKNFLNVQFILYHLLMKHGHRCDANNFSFPKTKGSRAFHDEVCLKIFNALGWVSDF